MKGLVVIIAAASLAACSSEETSSQNSNAHDVVNDVGGTALDVGPVPMGVGDTTTSDVSGTPADTVPTEDTGPIVSTDPCEQRCAPYTECGDAVMAACTATCEDEEVLTCEDACTETDKSCTRANQCFGVISGENAVPWSSEPYGTGYRDTVDEFVMPTLRGDWSFAEHWTGQDSYVFAMTQTGFAPGEALWGSNPYNWLDDSPRNVHYFFLSYHNGDGVDDASDNVAAIKARIDASLTNLSQVRGRPVECHWRRQIHYVPVSAWSLSSWMGEMLQEAPVLSFGIDRFQTLRPAGLLSLVNGTPLLQHLQYLPEYYNFERKRELDAYQGDTTTVTVFDNEAVNGKTVTVEFPSAEEISQFDTLEVDISQYCAAHDDQNCFEWDYKAFIEVRERPVEATGPDDVTACQGEIKAVAGSAEVMGTCPDESPCANNADCGEDLVCVGYEAAVDAVAPIAADTLGCDCVVPGKAQSIRESQKVCRADGTGYNECQCNEAWEVVRWITTYHREGRWVVDASPFLPLFDGGGATRLRFKGSYPYLTTLHFNFSNRGKADRASGIRKLFTGGGFGPNYSKDYPPLEMDIPDGTARAEVVAFITGHGFGGQPHNCAEFCNHTHHFTVNGAEFIKDHQYLDDYYGCAKQVAQGTVPNQFGTWTIGRGGWCPGLEVRPFIADVSDVMGDSATISYRGRLDGKDWEEGDATYGGSIWMNSYLVTYE